MVFVSHRVKECCFITSGWRCTASHSCSAARTSTAPPTPTTHQRMHAGCNSRGVYAEGLVHTPQTRVAASDTHATAPLAFAAISPPASAPAPAGAPTPAPRDVAGWLIRPSTTGCRTKRSTLLPFLRAAALATLPPNLAQLGGETSRKVAVFGGQRLISSLRWAMKHSPAWKAALDRCGSSYDTTKFRSFEDPS